MDKEKALNLCEDAIIALCNILFSAIIIICAIPAFIIAAILAIICFPFVMIYEIVSNDSKRDDDNIIDSEGE